MHFFLETTAAQLHQFQPESLFAFLRPATTEPTMTQENFIHFTKYLLQKHFFIMNKNEKRKEIRRKLNWRVNHRRMEFFLWKYALFIDLFLLLVERKLWFDGNCYDFSIIFYNNKLVACCRCFDWLA